jgi:maltose/moltooligosaccharide transporter
LIGGVLAALMLFALPNLDYIQNVLGISSIVVIALIVALTFDLSINISFNPTRSIIADVTPDGIPRTKGYTWMQTISGFFGVLSGVIGTLFGNYFLIYFGIFLILSFSIFPVLLVEEPKELNIEKDVIDDNSKKSKANWSELLKIYFAHAFSWVGVFTMFVYAVIFIQERYMPATDDESGQIWSAANIVFQSVGFLLPLFVLEPISEKIGRVKTHLIAVSIMAVGYFLIAFLSASPISFYIFMAVVGIGWASIVSLPFAIMSELVDKSRMGFFMGIFNLSVVLPQLIVSLVLSLVIQQAADKNIIFVISGVTLTISAILWIFVKEQEGNPLVE